VIEHTLLNAAATRPEIERLCADAASAGVFGVCVNPIWVATCRRALPSPETRVVSVVGFPFGASRFAVKALEAAEATSDGADELDMVASIGHIKMGDWTYVSSDVAAVVAAAGGRPVKAIIETALLTPEEIRCASLAVRDGGAAFVKTSTGTSTAGGASRDVVALIRQTVGESAGVKASGGIRDCARALEMIAAGASRIGTSNGAAIARCLGEDPHPLIELAKNPLLHVSRCAFVWRASPPS